MTSVKQVKYRGRTFPVKAEEGDYIIIESYGVERRVLKDEVIYEEPIIPNDVLVKPEDKLEETLPPSNDIVSKPEENNDEFHGKTVKNIRDGRIGKVASIGTLRHTANSESVTVYWETDPKNPQEVDKRLLQIIPDEEAQESVVTNTGQTIDIKDTVDDLKDQSQEVQVVDETPVLPQKLSLPETSIKTDLMPAFVPKEEDCISQFKEQMKSIWENSFKQPPALKAGEYEVDVEYPDSEAPGETLTYRVQFSLYGEGLSEMSINKIDDIESPQPDTADYDLKTLEDLVDEKLLSGEFVYLTQKEEEPELSRSSDYVNEIDEEATITPVAGGTNQGQPNDGVFAARIGQKVKQP